jgi:AcrR family transcriptional regulator
MSKAEITKQYIIEKTAPIFNRKGYAGTSLSDLTKATGLTKGSIYGNFENKDEVALAAFDYNFKVVSAAIAEKVASKDHAADKLRVYLTVFGSFHKNPAMEAGCPILNTATEADDTHAMLRARAAGAIGKWYAHLEKIIHEGIIKGEVKPDTDSKDFAGAFISLLEGGMMLAKVTGKMNGMSAAVKQGEKMIVEITK